MRKLNSYCVVSLAAVLATAAVGCGPGDPGVVFDSQGTFGLNYAPTVTFSTDYSDTSTGVSKTFATSIVATPPPAGQTYVSKAVLFYDRADNTLYVGNTTTVGTTSDIYLDPKFAYKLDANRSATIQNQTTVTPIASTTCAISKTTKGVITFDAAGDTFDLSVIEDESLVLNTSGSGSDCKTYLAAEKAKVQANAATDITNYADFWAVFVSQSAVDVNDMQNLTGFHLSEAATGVRIATTLTTPLSVSITPQSVRPASAPANAISSAGMDRVEFTTMDPISAQIFGVSEAK